LTGDEIEAMLASGGVQLLDVRSAEEYAGTDGYGCDPVQGHLPGAVNIEVWELAAAGSGVRELLAERGLDSNAPIVCYCHSGGRSAHAVALLAAAGVQADNYPGSWHEWSRRSTRDS
jgi:3-mercaptopyruvate sulfurtransferase SseA